MMKTIENILLLIESPTNPNKYLIYMDMSWGVWLFPNFPNKGQSLMEIKKQASELAGISLDYLMVQEKGTFEETKKCPAYYDEICRYKYRIVELHVREKRPGWGPSMATFETLSDMMEIQSVRSVNENLLNYLLQQ